MFDTTKRDLIGRHISKLMPGSPAIKVLEIQGEGILRMKRFSRLTEDSTISS